MKLRLAGDEARIRLDADDLTALATEGTVGGAMAVGETEWRYSLRFDPGVVELGVSLDASGFEVVIPAARGSAWLNSDEEGILELQEGLRLKIEKDRGCAH